MTSTTRDVSGARTVSSARTIPVLAFGMGLSTFLAVSFTLCVLGYVFLPDFGVQHSALSLFLPGFTLLSWQSFFLGLAESFAWGWYVALVFGPLYNLFAVRLS